MSEILDFPMPRAAGCPFAPPPEVLERSATKQLFRVRIWDGSTPWLVTGHEAIRSLFSDGRASVDDRKPGYPHWNEGMLATVHKRPRSVFTSDAEEHTRFRRMLSRPFTYKRVEALRPAVQRIADQHVDAILAGPKPADLVESLALAIPSLVISEMLGVPYEDAEFFQEQANKGMSRYACAEDAAQGAGALAKYLANLVRTKMDDPSEDLVSDLAERVKGEEISVREAAQLATGVLIAGHETTAGQIGVSILALLEHPDQLALLRDADDPKVIAAAVEELMRYVSIIQTGQRRIAVEDIEVGDELIRAGDGIILDVAPANWERMGVAVRHRDEGTAGAAAKRVGARCARHLPPAGPGGCGLAGSRQALPGRGGEARAPDTARHRRTHHQIPLRHETGRPVVEGTTMTTVASALYPPGGFGAPKNRCGHADDIAATGLPPGTEVFSADNHISLASDIFYERFPDGLKTDAPRIWYEDGAYMVGHKGQSFVVGDFSAVLMQYDDLAGASTNDVAARVRELAEDGVDRELAFPNAVLALFGFPDKQVRERAFRIYNEYIADIQERSDGRFYGVGLINWWDAKGAERTLSELKSLGLRTFLMPLYPGTDDDGVTIDYGSTAMMNVWDVIEASGIPVTHHIGETPPKSPCEFNSVAVAMMINVDSFRDMFARYIFSGILDRHPGLKIGWFEGGIAWIPPALQDAEHVLASYQHMLNHQLQHDIRYYWDTHMCASFMVDPLGLKLIDEIGVDKVMWSSDYPHNESTFGYSEKSLAAVVGAAGPENAVRIVSGNIKNFLGLT